MRIISGTKKSISIRAPKNLPVRPTTDKVKESLFNIISNLFEIILKSDSLTLSVVGLTGRFFGALIEILFLVPDIILIYN